MKLSLVAKFRIVVLMLAGLLFFGGCRTAFHPRILIVTPPATSEAASRADGYGLVTLRTSTASRVWGVFRMLVGSGLAFGGMARS